MEHTTVQSARCTNHPVLPQNQVLYLFDALIERAKYLNFDVRNYWRGDWEAVADTFNAKFEGIRVPGSAERQTKKSVEMLHCALVQNEVEFARLYGEAENDFQAEKREDARSKLA